MIRKCTLAGLIAVVALGCIPMAMAGEESTKFGGTVYYDYFVDLTDRGNDDATVTNGFQWRRVYITAKKSWGDVMFRYTTDIDPKYGTKNLNVYTKYAYLEWKGLVPDAKLLIGQHSPKTHGWVEKRWHYRSIAKTMSDANKWTNAAELGIGLQGKASEGKLEYNLDLNNGNGYKKRVAKDGMGASGRLAFQPIDGLYVSGLATVSVPGGSHLFSYTYAVDDTTEVTVEKTVDLDDSDLYLEGLVGYEEERFGLFASYGLYTNKQGKLDTSGFEHGDPFPSIVDKESSGLSAFGRARVAEKTYAVARFDWIDPDTDVDKDGHSLLIVGLDRKVHDGVYLQPTFRLRSYEDSDATDESAVVLTAYIKI